VAVPKQFVKPDRLLKDSFLLARMIYDSGFRPQVLLVLWRGGTPVGVVVHEFLLYKGIRTYHTAVKAGSYRGIGKRVEPRISNWGPVLRAIRKDSRVLVVDDIFDTGCTLAKVCRLLRRKTRNVRIATLYHKLGQNRTALVPDFAVRKTRKWIVFPHELMDLSRDEIRRKGRDIYRLVVEGAA
jgi:hypoxanthine phosphoribosyltransferase